MLQGVFGDLTQGDLPVLRTLLDGEFKTRAQQQIDRLEMEANLDPYIAHKLKRVINDEMGGVKSNYFNTDRKYNLMIINEQRENSPNYTAEKTKMEQLVKGELKSSKEIIPNQLSAVTKRAIPAKRLKEKGFSLGGSLKKTKKKQKILEPNI